MGLVHGRRVSQDLPTIGNRPHASYHAAVSTASSVSAFVALAWAAVLAWLAIGTVIRRAALQRRTRAQAGVSTSGKRVLLVRPCAGAEPGLLDNLVSARTIQSAARLTIVMSVDDPQDGARPVLEAALAQLGSCDARVEVHLPVGPNRKASMLGQVMREHDDWDFVVNVDSNIDLSGYPLDELLAPLLRDPRAGASWGPWSEVRAYPGLGPRASEAVLGASLTAFPLLCGIYADGLVGKIWAARREALAECDFESLTHYLGEDLEMANRLRAHGWGIVAASTLGRARGGEAGFRQVVERFGRWMLAVRGQRPRLLPTYPLFFFATPLVLLLAGLGAYGKPMIAVVAAGLAVMGRLIVTLAAQYWSGRRVSLLRALLEAVLGDLALGLAWVRALTRRDLEWRGHRLRVEPNGRLLAID
jgi:ceramide glucosyltransferase